jgi:hypothetical protein
MSFVTIRVADASPVSPIKPRPPGRTIVRTELLKRDSKGPEKHVSEQRTSLSWVLRISPHQPYRVHDSGSSFRCHPCPSDRARLEPQTTNLLNPASPASILVQGTSPLQFRNISRSLERRCPRGHHETLDEHYEEAGRQSVTEPLAPRLAQLTCRNRRGSRERNVTRASRRLARGHSRSGSGLLNRFLRRLNYS